MVVLLAPLAGCGLFGPDTSPDEVTKQFLDAFAAGDSAAAAARTDSADSASPLMDKVRTALKPAAVTAKLDRVNLNEDEDGATAAYTLSWDLGRGRTWSYPATADLRVNDGEWQVHWATSVLHPKLAAQQSIVLREEDPPLAPVLDRDGVALLNPENVVSILFEQAKAGDVAGVTGRLAGAVARFDPTITPRTITDGAAKRPGQAYQVALLRDTDYQLIKPEIYDLPGVRFQEGTRLLPVDRTLATQLIPSLRKTVEDQVAGRAGWRVVTLGPTGSEVDELHIKQAQPANAVATSLGRGVQAAAEAAIDPLPTPAMIVALQPSTGDVLAVAQNAPADAQGPIALTGQYPPGSTFKIATSVAALHAGTITADTPVPCPGSMTIGPRLIPNSGGFDKGTIPLFSAFAFSCNTTFAQLAAGMPEDALTEAASRLGIGVDFVIPGITTITGSVPPGKDTTERAEEGIGQGRVVASPFGMAVAAATVASGTLRNPALLRGTTTKADSTPKPIEQPVLDAVRRMMREVVTGGTAGGLAGLPNVYGKTGTAQFGDGKHSHGWFVGYRDDIAFAVLVTDAGVSAPAIDAAKRFLEAPS